MRKGIVTLAGQLGSAEQHGLIRIAVRLAWNMDGVVDVVNKLGVSITPSIPSAQPAVQRHAGVCQDNKLQPHTPLNPQEFVAGQGQDRTVDLPLTGKSPFVGARQLALAGAGGQGRGGRGWWGASGGAEFGCGRDVQAEGLELADVVADLALPVDVGMPTTY